MTLQEELGALGITIPEGLSIDELAAQLTDHPARNLLVLLGVTTLAFYAAEREKNPKVGEVWDAMVYTTTCLSVGYGDIFARTPAGKAIGSLLMTVGPSMVERFVDGPGAQAATTTADPVQQEILATLKQILARLDQTPAGA